MSSASLHHEPDDATRVIAAIWCDLLGGEAPGATDNFFDSGGDSLLAITFAARAADRGINIAVADVFESETFTELAACAVDSLRTLVAGEPSPRAAPLTPVQHRGFEDHPLHPEHHTVCGLFEPPPGMTLDDLHRAVKTLAATHDALSLTFPHVGEQREQTLGDPPAVRGVRVERNVKAVRSQSYREQASLNLERGPIARCVAFTDSSDRIWAILLVVHHAVCDGISWMLLSADLRRALEPTAPRRPVQGPTSYLEWARRLSHYSSSSEIELARMFWLEQAERISELPRARSSHDRSLRYLADVTHRVAWSGSDSETDTSLEALILAAVNYALQVAVGDSVPAVDVRAHGRDQLATGLSLARTVGWFAGVTPVITRIGCGRHALDTLEATRVAVAEIPHPRISFGCLRYLYPDRSVRQELARLRPRYCLHVRGRLGDAIRSTSGLQTLDFDLGPNQNPREQQPYSIKIFCDLVGDDLVVTWRYSVREYRAETISALAGSFTSAIALYRA